MVNRYMRKREGIRDRKKDDLFLSWGNYGKAQGCDEPVLLRRQPYFSVLSTWHHVLHKAKTSQKRWVLVSGSNTSLSLKKQIRSCPIRPCVTDSFLNWKGMAKFKFGVFQRFFRNNRKEKMYLADGAVDYGGYQWTGSHKFKIITQNPKMFCLFVFIQKITKKCDYVLCVNERFYNYFC